MKDFQHKLFDEVHYFEKVRSTNIKAQKLIKDASVYGNLLVISRIQSGGIGRNRNRWFSPNGGLWMTAALYGLSVASNLTIFTGICIHKTIIKLFPKLVADLKIKWPNDIYLGDRKLCGILSSKLQNEKYHLLGIGLNSNVCELPEEMVDIAVSLKQYLNIDVDNKMLAAELFDLFAQDLPQFIEGNLDTKYFNQYSLLTNKNIILDTDFDQFSGLYKGINKSGAILIELKPGMIQPFYAGSVISWE